MHRLGRGFWPEVTYEGLINLCWGGNIIDVLVGYSVKSIGSNSITCNNWLLEHSHLKILSHPILLF